MLVSSSHDTRSAIQDYVDRIRPAERSVEAVLRHRRTIEQALGRRLAVSAVRPVGSYTRGTAIEGSSDADYLAVLRKDSLRWGDQEKSSETVLRQVRDALSERFRNTNVTRDGQAIRVHFSDGPVDVVPAVYDGPAPGSGHPVYRIPDGNGGWMRTSPDADNKYLRDANSRSGGMLRSTALAVKAFRDRTQAPVPIKSLYVEMAIARSGAAEGVGKSRTQCLRDALVAIDESDCRPLPNPTGVGDPIYAANTPAQRDAARTALARAADRAQKAVAAEERGNHVEARRLWGVIFRDQL